MNKNAHVKRIYSICLSIAEIDSGKRNVSRVSFSKDRRRTKKR